MVKNNKKKSIHRVKITRPPKRTLCMKRGKLVSCKTKKRPLSVFRKSDFTIVSKQAKPTALTPAQRFRDSRIKQRKLKSRRISGVETVSALR